jgi:hypothetical protein
MPAKVNCMTGGYVAQKQAKKACMQNAKTARQTALPLKPEHHPTKPLRGG